MPSEIRRKTPEELLREVQDEECAAHKGHLKIVLGYASGVGKSFRMLDEARRRRERGQNVIVGGIQPKVPPEVEAVLQKLDVIPLKIFPEGTAIDVEAIVRRHPAVCVIDGLAYDNPAGTKNAARWLDVLDLMSAGIKVIGSINIQYVAELQDDVQRITGKRATQTVPVSFVHSADEIELVDAPPQEPIERSPEEEIGAAKRQQQLSRLRELALVLTAEVVDHQLNDYLESRGIHQQFGAHERIMVCITPRANVHEMLGMARAIAQRFHAELIAAYVHQAEISAQDKAALDEKLTLARSAGARIEILDGEDPIDTILDFAKSRRVTQLFIGHSQRSGLWPRIWGNPVDKLIRKSRGMDVRVFPQ